MAQPVQTYVNHKRIVPAYHGVTFSLLILLLIWWGVLLVRGFTGERLLGLLTTLVLGSLFFHGRTFALRVQDRVVRVEERLRMERLLPGDLRSRIGEFSLGQLIALRFASDAELPGLARRVLEERLTDKDQIKQLVREWRADHLRA